MPQRVIITGSAGFIGFHAARALQRRGDEVAGIDNFNDYYDVQLKKDRAAALEELGVKVHKIDLGEASKLAAFIKEFQPTHILHLAAQAGVRYSIENPHAYIASNITGFLNLLEICRSIPEVPVVYASSSSVYGLNDTIPFSTDDRTDQQASLYGVTKKSNELMAHTYNHLYGIPLTGLRFFTVYGPWGRPDMAYFKFTKAMLAGEEIPVYNHGKLSRDFTYIDDIVEGILKALERTDGCAVYNLGNNQPETLENFIGAIEKALGIEAHRKYLPMQAGDVLQTYADIQQSQSDLGFEAKVTLEEGLAQFIQWYRAYFHSEVLSR